MKSLLLSFLILSLGLQGCKSRKESETNPVASDNVAQKQVHLCLEPQTKPEARGKVTLNQTPLEGATSSTLSGQILDIDTGEPIGSATVILRKNGAYPTGTIADENGRFTITSIANGDYEIEIRFVDYITLETELHINSPSSIQLKAQLDTQSEESPVEVVKPVIYLYPTEKTEVAVQLRYDGKLTHTYPAYPENGWKVIAEPNGTLYDEKGMEYYALFWEGEPSQPLAPKNGFVVPGRETASFLEEKLAFLGLSRREANEFIMYWLPKMEDNAYNLIHFAGQEYEEQAALLISPEPETSIRVMMVTCPLERVIDFPLQDLSAMKKTRRGYTMVEWGGSVISSVKGSEAF